MERITSKSKRERGMKEEEEDQGSKNKGVNFFNVFIYILYIYEKKNSSCHSLLFLLFSIAFLGHKRCCFLVHKLLSDPFSQLLSLITVCLANSVRD